MFVERVVLSLVVAAVGFAALGAARPSSGAGREVRYAVRPGDTLWTIADARYDGDPREAVWRIEKRNGLPSGLIRPGSILVLPP